MRIIKRTKRIKTKEIKKWKAQNRIDNTREKKYSVYKSKKMFTPENAVINIVDDAYSMMQNISLENITLAENVCSSTGSANKQLSSRHRNNQLCDKETADNTSSDHKNFITNDTTKWDDSEQQIQEETDNDWKLAISWEESDNQMSDDWMKISLNEKRSLDSPTVVEVPLDSFSLLNVPQTFERQSRMQPERVKFHNKKAFRRGKRFNEDSALIINTECLNPKDNAPVEYETRASPVQYNTNETDQVEDVTIGNSELEKSAINIAVDVNSSPVLRRSFESRESSASGNSNAETCGSPELEDTSALQHEGDRNRRTEDNVTISNSKPRNTIVGDIGSTEGPVYKGCRSRGRFPKLTYPQDFEEISMHSRRRKKPQLYSIRNVVIVIMDIDSGFCFSGKLLVKVLYGAVEVYGAVLDASMDATAVYSPRGYSSVVVETSKEFPKGSVEDTWDKLSAEGIARDCESKLQDDIGKVEPGMAVLMLRNFENNLTLFLRTHYPIQLFPSVKNTGYYPWVHRQRAEAVLQARLHDDSTRRQLIVPAHIVGDMVDGMLARWRQNKWSCALVAGGKSVGKSTSVRFLINRLLRTCGKVALVDVDPGQAECTPAGCISCSLIEQPLTGPNFTHLQTPVYQLFIDEINVAQCVTRYLEGVRMLIDKLKQCPVLSRLPVVVNTMGFTQHIGWDLAIVTIKLVRPSVILQILSIKSKKNYADFLDADTVNKQERKWTFCDETFVDWERPCDHEIRTIYSNAEIRVTRSSSEWNMEPYQQRELVMISYLSGITRDGYDPSHYSVGLPLSISEAVPCTTPFSSLCIIPQRLFGVPASHALSVINGNIVALCGIDLTQEESTQEPGDASSLRVLTQRSPLCTCYGFGIVRGVDVERQQVFVNTPLPISMMQHVNCLAGCIPVPPALLQLNQGAPYVGEDATLPTSRKPRMGYFRLKHRTRPNHS